MAFVDDENLDPNAPPPSGGGSTLVTGQGGSSNSRTVNNSSAPNSPGGMPGNFVGIQQYLDANKPQSAQLANQVGGYVTDLANTARSTVSGAKNQFQSDVDQNTVNLDQNLLSEAQANPQGVDSNTFKRNSFQKMYNASYGGPTNFEQSSYYQPALQATQSATDAISQAASPEGQTQLVSNLEKKTGGYSTPGATSFDTALLQASPNAREVLGNVISNNKDLKANLDAVVAEENKAAQNAAQTTANTAQTVQGIFGNNALQNQIQNALIQKATNQNNATNAEATSLLYKLNNNQPLTPQELQMLHIDQGELNQIQGGRKYIPTLNPYVGLTNTNITGENIATPEDYARYAALNDLTGQNANYLSNPALAGTANVNGITPFNLNQYLQDVAKASYKAPAPRPVESVSGGMTVSGLPTIEQTAKALADTRKQVLNPVGTVKNAIKAWSDVNLKTNIEKFDASKFLDSFTKEKRYG